MTPRLHPDTIEAVKEKADIVDVVSEHVVLKKRGKDFVGLCPFHDDKSPSFTVSPAKQFYYCFSCGAGGNSFKFLMELGKQPFGEVVLQLARKYQVAVKTLEPEDRQEFQRQLSIREQLYEVLSLTARFFEHALYQPQGKEALAYLESSRQFSRETIQQFQLGYAPAGWDTLYGYLVEQKHYPLERVEQAGLILPRKDGNRYYDRFRNRLMIPIHDVQGRVIGFGGRALGDDQPKYLNSPETELFDKGKTLFALDKARATIAKQDQAIVVEGYFDAIALHAAGITNTVASLGTALSQAQIRQLLRYTESKRIIFNFDADAAGTRAAERAIGEVADLAYQGQVQLRVLNIPEGKDPDEFLRTHSPEDYGKLLDQAPLWLDWQIQQGILGRDLKQADQFQQAVQEVVKLLGNLPNAALRTHYVHHTAGLLSRGDARLALRIEEDLRLQVRGQRWHGRSQKWERSADYTLREAAEAQLLRIYLHCPDYRSEVREALETRDLEFGLSHHRFLWRQILALEAEHPIAPPSDDGTVEVPPPPDLLIQLQDRLMDFSAETKQIYSLFQLDEKTKLDIDRPHLNIRTAVACLERIMSEKRSRHFLKLWEESWANQEGSSQAAQEGAANDEPSMETEPLPSTEQTEFSHLNQFYKEKQYLQQLEQQRWIHQAEANPSN